MDLRTRIVMLSALAGIIFPGLAMAFYDLSNPTVQFGVAGRWGFYGWQFVYAMLPSAIVAAVSAYVAATMVAQQPRKIRDLPGDLERVARSLQHYGAVSPDELGNMIAISDRIRNVDKQRYIP